MLQRFRRVKAGKYDDLWRKFSTICTFQLVGIELDALWLVLAYIMQEMDKVDVCVYWMMLNWSNLLRVQNIDNLDLVLTTIVSRTYSMAMALYQVS